MDQWLVKRFKIKYTDMKSIGKSRQQKQPAQPAASTAPNDRALHVLRQIVTSLPSNKNWLDPHLEAEARALIQDARPNAEIDAEVAEKVMGWKKDEDNFWLVPGGDTLSGEPERRSHFQFKPTEIPSHAQEVITKKMGLLHGGYKVRIDLSQKGNDVTFYTYPQLHTQFGERTARHRSLPMAICLAALKAVALDV